MFAYSPHVLLAAATCTVNGEPAECGQTLSILGVVFIPLLIFFCVLAVFWVISLIHLVKHPDVPNRLIWIVLHFIFLGPLAGIIYFFAVKRGYDKGAMAMTQPGAIAPAVPPTSTLPPQPPAM